MVCITRLSFPCKNYCSRNLIFGCKTTSVTHSFSIIFINLRGVFTSKSASSNTTTNAVGWQHQKYILSSIKCLYLLLSSTGNNFWGWKVLCRLSLQPRPLSFRNQLRKGKAEEVYVPADAHSQGTKWGFAVSWLALEQWPEGQARFCFHFQQIKNTQCKQELVLQFSYEPLQGKGHVFSLKVLRILLGQRRYFWFSATERSCW